MKHVAIMSPKLGFLEKILDGRKTIESRWHTTRRAPWDKVKKGDTIYFKNSGEPVMASAKVKAVKQFEALTPQKAEGILNKYGRAIGLESVSPPQMRRGLRGGVKDFYQVVKNKKYCILIWLEKPKPIKPFQIDKRGYGAMAGWMVL